MISSTLGLHRLIIRLIINFLVVCFLACFVFNLACSSRYLNNRKKTVLSLQSCKSSSFMHEVTVASRSLFFCADITLEHYLLDLAFKLVTWYLVFTYWLQSRNEQFWRDCGILIGNTCSESVVAHVRDALSCAQHCCTEWHTIKDNNQPLEQAKHNTD